MNCTWRNCRQLSLAADIDHPQWSAWRLFRLPAVARGWWVR